MNEKLEKMESMAMVRLKIDYLRELRGMFEGDTLNATGKSIWLEKAHRLCNSIERDLEIRQQGE